MRPKPRRPAKPAKPAKPIEPAEPPEAVESARSGQPLSAEELDARLRMAADEMITEVKAWQALHPEATLSEIEVELLKVRQRVTEQMGAALIEAQPSRRPRAKPTCPSCGRRMRFKDDLETGVQSQVGVLRYRRGYYYCPHCKGGLFPPGSPPAASGGELQ